MALGFFDQFASPTLLGIPLVGLALAFPCLLLPRPTDRWLKNRILTLQT